MSSSINFSDEEIRNLLKQHLTGPNKDLLSACIHGLNANTDWRQEKLIKASMGIEPICELSINDIYLIHKSEVSTYDIDEDASLEAGLLDVDGNLSCKLTKFNPWEPSMYHIVYKYKKIGGESRRATYDTVARYLKVKEEFPEDLI